MTWLRSKAAAVVDVGMRAAAAMHRRRAGLVDAIGAACVAVFAASFDPRWAWLVVGVYLLVRAPEVEGKP